MAAYQAGVFSCFTYNVSYFMLGSVICECLAVHSDRYRTLQDSVCSLNHSGIILFSGDCYRNGSCIRAVLAVAYRIVLTSCQLLSVFSCDFRLLFLLLAVIVNIFQTFYLELSIQGICFYFDCSRRLGDIVVLGYLVFSIEDLDFFDGDFIASLVSTLSVFQGNSFLMSFYQAGILCSFTYTVCDCMLGSVIGEGITYHTDRYRSLLNNNFPLSF